MFFDLLVQLPDIFFQCLDFTKSNGSIGLKHIGNPNTKAENLQPIALTKTRLLTYGKILLSLNQSTNTKLLEMRKHIDMLNKNRASSIMNSIWQSEFQNKKMSKQQTLTIV